MSDKKRAPNFTKEEVTRLFCLVIKYKDVIENKKTDSVTWKEKEAAWATVTERFNSTNPSGTFRPQDSLRKMYDNKKKEVRKERAKENLQANLTGGGPGYVNKDPDPNFDLIAAVINTRTIDGLYNEFDGDNEIKRPDKLETIVITSEKESNESNSKIVDWGDYKAEHLKGPINVKLNKKKVSTDGPGSSKTWSARRRPIANSLPSSTLTEEYSNLAAVKLELATLQLNTYQKSSKYLENLWEKKMKMEEEKHILELRSLELDILIKETVLQNVRKQ